MDLDLARWSRGHSDEDYPEPSSHGLTAQRGQGWPGGATAA